MKSPSDPTVARTSTERNCKCPNGSYGKKHTSECYETEIARLRNALQMIADETLCPDLWREEDRKDWPEDYLAHRTALVIAHAALEPADAQ